MEAQRSTNFNEFYRSTGEHSVNIRAKECFGKVLYHVNLRILKCKMTNVITMYHPYPLSQKMFPPSSWVFFRSMQFIPYRLVFYDGSKHDKICEKNIFKKN
jgi:hypothetical protein